MFMKGPGEIEIHNFLLHFGDCGELTVKQGLDLKFVYEYVIFF